MERKKVGIAILVIVTSAVIICCINIYRYRSFKNAFSDIYLEEVDKIRIVDQGNEIISDDNTLIEQFTSLLNQLVIRKSPPQLPATGNKYTFVLFSGDTKILTVNTYWPFNRIDFNFNIYYARNPEVIEAIEKLIEEQYN